MAGELFNVRWKTPQGRERVLRWMDDIERKWLNPGDIIEWAGPQVQTIMVWRTVSGLGLDDKPFRPYSTRYAQLKKGGRLSPVTLKDQGDMLGLVQFKKRGTRAGVVFVGTGGTPNRAAIAAAHHRGVGVPQREWVGMSRKDMQALNERTIDHLERLLRGRLPPEVRQTANTSFRGRAPFKNTGNPK